MKILLLRILAALVLAFAGSAQAASTLEGQVVCCKDCWVEADRSKVEYGTTADLANAARCVAGGDPTLLAVHNGAVFELYRLDQGKFRLPGKDWLEFVGSHVRVTGQVGAGEDRSIRVDAVEVMTPSLAAKAGEKVVGQTVALTLKDLTGATQNLSAMAGRIVVVNFWATYCVPCRTEMPDLTAIQNDYAALGVQVIGASADTLEQKTQVLQFIKEAKVNFPVWLGVTTADMMRFGLSGSLPGTVIVGKDGKIAKVMAGVVHQSELKSQIDAMLATADAASQAEQMLSQDETADSAEVSSVPS